MVTMGKKWRFADKGLKNADWCFESPLLPLLPPKCHVIPSDSEGSPDTSAILAHLQFRHFFPCAPQMHVIPSRSEGSPDTSAILAHLQFRHFFPCAPQMHVIPSDSEGSPDTSAILAHLQFRHFFPCLPHMPCHPERQRGISLYFRYFHTFPTPPLRPYCAGMYFILFRKFQLRRLLLERPLYYKYFAPPGL